jgi:hypothetical protein
LQLAALEASDDKLSATERNEPAHTEDLMEQVTAQDTKQSTRKAVRTVAGQASERAKTAFELVTHETSALAGALRGAAEQAQRDGTRVVHEPLRKMADFCEQLGQRTGQRSPGQMVSGLADLGRREPLMMLFGATAALGLLGTRAVRARGLSKDGQGEQTSSQKPEPSDESKGREAMGGLEPTMFTPAENDSPASDRDTAVTASTTGGMSEDQARSSGNE